MDKAKHTLKVLRDRCVALAYMPDGLIIQALYKIANTQFNRELRSVRAGIRSHNAAKRQGNERYSLRRHIHMIEKGLSMRPRRTTFAADYIEETVYAYQNYAPDPQGESELRWISAVLQDYFMATIESREPAIVAARQQFESARQAALSAATEYSAHPVGNLSSAVSISDLSNLAHSRSSVRWFTDKPVSRDQIDRAIDLAREAPSACNRLPWTFRIFEDSSDAREVASYALGTRGWNQQIKHVAVLVGNLGAYSNERDRHLIYIDGSLAAMSFVLGLQAQDIASCCINWPDVPSQERKISDALGLEAHERVVMLIAFGHADPDGLTPFSGKVEMDSVRRYQTLTQSTVNRSEFSEN